MPNPPDPCCRVLVVDRDREVRTTLAAMLSDRAREVVLAADLTEARSFADAEPFDIVFVEDRAPDGDPLALIDALAAANPELLSVMLSERPSAEEVVEQLRRGIHDYLFKPISDDSGRSALATIARATDQVTRRRHEQALLDRLALSEERLSLALRATSEGLWDWDLTRNYVYLSRRWKAQLGFAPDELGNSPDEWFARIHPDDLERFKTTVGGQLSADTDQFELEYRIRDRDGQLLWVRCHGVCIRDPSGRAVRMVGSQLDITRRKEMEERLVHDALHDGLTGLPNRVLLRDRLDAAIRRMQRNPERGFAVLFIDLDRFKNVNDSLGHAAGDELLIAIGQRLSDCLRQGDTLARIGGDEFVVLVIDLDHPGAVPQLIHRIESELQRPIEVRGHELVTSASIGVATSAVAYQNADEVLRDADIAMYRAKAAGRAGHAVFVGQMHVQAVKYLRLETDLRRALTDGECDTHYQPIVRLSDMELAGFESLARWTHPVHGPISPAEFIPIAEETGLVVKLGEWSLRESCTQMERWRHQEGGDQLRMAVNLSARQFGQPGLLERVTGILAETGLPPNFLEIEITEGVFIGDIDRAAEALHRLREIGVRLSLDDFGTGYSSLSYLHRLPFHTLKIDRNFVTEMEREPRVRQLVEGIVTLAVALGLEVVAEGIESAGQLAFLRELGCTYGQGYYLTPPVPAERASQIVASPWFASRTVEPAAERANRRRSVTLRYGESDPEFAAVVAGLREEASRPDRRMRRETRNTLRLLGELSEEILAGIDERGAEEK